MSSITNPYKVRLDSFSQGRSNTATQSVIFDVMPTISQGHSVDYQAFDPVHSPGSYYVYRGTKAVTFELGVRLVSRTTDEATQNLGYLNILRGWTRGYFGFGTSGTGNIGISTSTASTSNTSVTSVSPLTQADLISQFSQGTTTSLTAATTTLANTSSSSPTSNYSSLAGVQSSAYAQQYLSTLNATQVSSGNTVTITPSATTVTATSVYAEGKALLGAPPEVLQLTAYSSALNESGLLNKMTNITNIPVVILNLNYAYTNDCDYIPTIQGQPFPIIMDIAISLVESHSPAELEQFDIYKYRAGTLPGF